MATRLYKKVYIFGAGASVAAGLPIQSRVLNKIFTLTKPERISMNDFLGTLDPYAVTLIDQFPKFEKCRRVLTEFIVYNFGGARLQNLFTSIFKYSDRSQFEYKDDNTNVNDEWTNIYNLIKDIDLSLEDLFTLLDKASLLKEYFRAYSVTELDSIQDSLNYCVVYSISKAIYDSRNQTIYDQLANFFLKKRIDAKQKNDIFSIITLNWDTLLDKHLYDACTKHSASHPHQTIYPDYCCYNNDIKSVMPSVHIQAKGNYNIKLMKLHGSINWLTCSNCGRLYTDYANNISLQYSESSKAISCIHCSTSFKKYELRRLIITPTFLKAFNNIHLKNVWHNAYLDLCDANEIIFIGYSFPDADFELRYLLKKAVKIDAKIKVILHNSDAPATHIEYVKRSCPKSKKDELIARLNLPYKRYESFFKNHSIEFYYQGLENAITCNIL